jgi:hypothetical protein
MRSLDDVRRVKADPDKGYDFVAFRPQSTFSDQISAS